MQKTINSIMYILLFRVTLILSTTLASTNKLPKLINIVDKKCSAIRYLCLIKKTMLGIVINSTIAKTEKIKSIFI